MSTFMWENPQSRVIAITLSLICSAVGFTVYGTKMSSALTFIVLGTTNFFGVVPNGMSTVPAAGSVPSVNKDLMQFQAALYNYTNSPGIGAHKIYTPLKTWNAARRACEEVGAHLLIINSVAESEVVTQLMRNNSVPESWVGIHDHYEESEFVTIHGESLVQAGFNEWRTGEPNNAGNVENCAVVTDAGLFVDLNCSTMKSYICELPRVQSCQAQVPRSVGTSLPLDLVSPGAV